MTAPARPRPRPLVLVVLDGVGERTDRSNNAVRSAKTPTLASLADYPRTRLSASGADVGMPKGFPGGGEVGALNLGAGRIAMMDLSRITAAIADHTLHENLGVADVLRIAKHHFEGRLHLFGLVDEASLVHLRGVIDAAHHEGVKVVVHAILDGRDAPRGGVGLLARVEDHLERRTKGIIGTISGRLFAMDPEPRWDRVGLAYKAIVRGVSPRADTVADALDRAYDTGKNDDTIEPIRVGEYSGMKGSFMCDFAGEDRTWRWFGEENAFAWGHRGDGLDKLFSMLLRQGVPPEVEKDMLTDRGKSVTAFDKRVFATLTQRYDPSLGLPFAFPREVTTETLGELISAAGLTQLRCAEGDRRAEITTFWSGAREEPFAGEERLIIDSPPRVAGRDPAVEATAAEVAARAAEAIRAGKHDVVIVGLSGADVAARTGKFELTVRAVEAVDAALGVVLAAVREAGGALVITASHGNAEQLQDDRGQRHTGATTSRVPFYYVNEADRGATLRDGGRLADVAPTLLDLLGLPKPDVMTGETLLPR